MTFTWICGKDADWLVLNVQDGCTNQDAALDKYRKSHAAEHVVFTGVQLRAIWLRTHKIAGFQTKAFVSNYLWRIQSAAINDETTEWKAGVFLIFYKARSTGLRTLLKITGSKTMKIKSNTCNTLQF